jgi:hypothetical protein
MAEPLAALGLRGRVPEPRSSGRQSRHSSKKTHFKIERRTPKQEFLSGRWESGNPKTGFPLSHRPDSLRRKEKTKPFTQTS